MPACAEASHKVQTSIANGSTADVAVIRIRSMTLRSDTQESKFLEFFGWGWGVRLASNASGLPEHLAYAFLLELDGFAFDPTDADDVPCPRAIDAVYEHLRHGCLCSELRVADGLGICRPRFARWMAKSGPDGLPECQALARALTRAYEEAGEAIEARERQSAATDKGLPSGETRAAETQAGTS